MDQTYFYSNFKDYFKSCWVRHENTASPLLKDYLIYIIPTSEAHTQKPFK